MKFAIVAIVLLATVVGVYSQAAKAAVNPKNLTPKEIAEIQAVLTKIVGPKLSKTVTKLIVSLANGILGGVPLKGVLRSVVQLLVKLLKSHGILAKLLGGGNSNAAGGGAKGANGQLKNLTPADQQRLIAILSRTLGPYTASYIVKLVATLVDGLLGKIPLHSILHSVTGLVEKTLNAKGLLGKLLGRKGLGGPISKLLGATGSIL